MGLYAQLAVFTFESSVQEFEILRKICQNYHGSTMHRLRDNINFLFNSVFHHQVADLTTTPLNTLIQAPESDKKVRFAL